MVVLVYKGIFVIVGACGKIGRMITKELVKENVPIILFDLEPSVLELCQNNKLVISYCCDVSNEKVYQEYLRQGCQQLNSKIAYLIVASGMMSYKSIEEESMEQYEQVLKQNLLVPIQLAKSVLSNMREQNFGRIIYLSSAFSKLSISKTSAYSISKAALNSFVKILANENKSYNILVNAVAPGLMRGGFSNKYLEEMFQDKKLVDSYTDMYKTFVSEKEVVEMILCLIKSVSINGQVIFIDNGYTIGRL